MRALWKNKFLILRRLVQVGILGLFILGNYAVLELRNHQEEKKQWVQNTYNQEVKGSILGKENLSSVLSGDLSFSKVFGVIPLSDPFATLQLFVAGGVVAVDLWLGFLIVVGFYGIFAGRAYCAYVCPINLVSDFASFLRRKLGLNALKGVNIPRGLKYGVLVLALILSAIFAIPAFESINPVSALHRGVVFGMGFGILGVALIFLFDLFVLKNGFCGHICPIGATFSLIGKFSLLRIKHNASNCTKCMECIKICPEPQVLDMIGKESVQVKQMACLRCGRCVEVCQDDALKFSLLGEKK